MNVQYYLLTHQLSDVKHPRACFGKTAQFPTLICKNMTRQLDPGALGSVYRFPGVLFAFYLGRGGAFDPVFAHSNGKYVRSAQGRLP